MTCSSKIFNELQGKIQHILRVVKAIVAAHKNSRGRLGDADSMDASCGVIWDYIALKIYHLKERLPFFEANLNKIPIFEGLIGRSKQI